MNKQTVIKFEADVVNGMPLTSEVSVSGTAFLVGFALSQIVSSLLENGYDEEMILSFVAFGITGGRENGCTI